LLHCFFFFKVFSTDFPLSSFPLLPAAPQAPSLLSAVLRLALPPPPPPYGPPLPHLPLLDYLSEAATLHIRLPFTRGIEERGDNRDAGEGTLGQGWRTGRLATKGHQVVLPLARCVSIYSFIYIYCI
jgi:hypothetical protein